MPDEADAPDDRQPAGGPAEDLSVYPAAGAPAEAWELARDPEAAWRKPPPGRLIGKGHPTGDFLEAHEWRIVAERPGYYQLEAHLPSQVRNLRGDLFGGFSPTYVDLLSLRTVVAAREPEAPRGRLVTLSMHVDYFAPVTGPHFLLECEVRHRRGKNWLVETRFRNAEGELLLLAMTTLRDMA